MLTATASLTATEAHQPAAADPLADERVVSEQYLANLIGTHVQQVRIARRKDAERGITGERAPVPTWISPRRIGYRVKHIREWLDRRTADGQPFLDNAA